MPELDDRLELGEIPPDILSCSVSAPHSHINGQLYKHTTHPVLNAWLCRRVGTTLTAVLRYESNQSRRGRPPGSKNRTPQERELDAYHGLRGL